MGKRRRQASGSMMLRFFFFAADAASSSCSACRFGAFPTGRQRLKATGRADCAAQMAKVDPVWRRLQQCLCARRVMQDAAATTSTSKAQLADLIPLESSPATAEATRPPRMQLGWPPGTRNPATECAANFLCFVMLVHMGELRAVCCVRGAVVIAALPPSSRRRRRR